MLQFVVLIICTLGLWLHIIELLLSLVYLHSYSLTELFLQIVVSNGWLD